MILYAEDSFRRPYPFQGDVVVDISDVREKKLQLVHCHTSQLYEWLRWMDHTLDQVPQDEEERFAMLQKMYSRYFASGVARWQKQLTEKYGAERAAACTACEAFEVSEYGGALTEELKKEIFPF